MNGTLFLLSVLAAGCLTENPEPGITGPEPPSPITLLARDSITEGHYRGIQIDSPAEAVFSVLEDYRAQKLVSYQSAVNNYFSDLTDIKDRIHLFDQISFDEKSDTDSGVQIRLESGEVKAIQLNSRRELMQWPENAAASEAIQPGDQTAVLYDKLVLLSAQTEYKNRFGRMMLSTRYSYALYDPVKARLPWRFVYFTEPGLGEEVSIHFKDKKVLYITVNRFQKI